jgi:amino acid adenylation domain-containing protein/non-ribosomal peptide synthase protein (TIGR01720 family)
MEDIKAIVKELRSANVRLSVNNGNIEIESLPGEMSNDVLAKIRANKEGLIQYFSRNTGAPGFSRIKPVEESESYLLSSAQRRLWVLSQFEESNITFNIPRVYTFEGALNTEALQYSFSCLVERHESLRTVFKENATGEVRQFVNPVSEAFFNIVCQDFSQLPDRESVVRDLVSNDISIPFNLECGPLLRAGLYQVEHNKWVFCYVMHHIISDGWSMGVLLKELLFFYNAFVNGETVELDSLNIQYKDYAAWQQQQLKGDVFEAHRAYWIEQFSGELPLLQMPCDSARPPIKTYNGGAISRLVDPLVVKNLKALCQEQGGTLFMGLLAAVNALLYRYTGQEDIIIGSPIAGRQHADLEGQIGFYLNILPLRSRFKGTGSFSGLFDDTRKLMLEAYAHQAFPFDELIDELHIQRDMSRSALFDVLIDFHDSGSVNNQQPGGLSVELFDSGEHTASKFDLTFMFIESGGELYLSLEYNSDLYKKETAERIQDHFAGLLSAATAAPSQPVAKLEYISNTERSNLLYGFNNLPDIYEHFPSVTGMFKKHAAAAPDNVAVSYGSTVLTYRELDEKSDQLAAYLRYTCYAAKGDLIGVMLDRSEKMIIAVLGILKSGCAYVPIDPAYPAARREYIISDTSVKVLITQTDYIFDLQNYEGHVFAADVQLDGLDTAAAPLDVVLANDDIAYVIYTSGSTGNPKGCALTHGNLSNYIHWANGYYFKNVSSVVFGLYTSLAFDLTITSIYCPLTNGGSLVIYPQHEELSSILQHSFREDSGINSIKLTPSHIRFIKGLGLHCTTMQCAIVGGEAVTQEDVSILKAINPLMQVYNEYGPTETTVGCVVKELEENSVVNIGYPISQTGIYVLDENGELCGTGIAGELHIAGAGVASGYLNQDLLTKEKFVKNSFREGERMYKTGDLCRRLAGGETAFLGRKDEQVKIRGYRTEPGEIECLLLDHPDVESAVVTVTGGIAAEAELVAYFTAKKELTRAMLVGYLSNLLPAYMIPGYFVQIAELPLTVNGKVDKKALPGIDGRQTGTGTAYEAPRDETEEKLVMIWQQVLGCERIGIKDDFFDLGGQSLKATRLSSLIQKEFNVRIELRDLFTVTVLENQAQLIQQAEETLFTTIPAATQQDNYPLSSSQRRLWLLSKFAPNTGAAYHMTSIYNLTGALDEAMLCRAFDSLSARHESLRTVFREDAAGEVRQYIIAAAPDYNVIVQHDLRYDTAGEETVRRMAETDMSTPFDLARGPLMRVSLYRIAGDKWVLSYVMHHVISDGWSMEILIKELLVLYNSFVNGLAAPLSPLRIQYKDYASWQQQQLKGGAFSAHRTYWLEQLGGELPVLHMPCDSPRPAVKTYNGGAVVRQIPPVVVSCIKSLSQEHGATLFMGLFAAVNALLYRYTGQSDIIIGSPVAGREHSDLEDQIGIYLNTLPIRSRFKGEDSYLALLGNIHNTTLDAYAHQAYPLDELVDELSFQRDMSRSALFDVLLDFHESGAEQGSGKLDNVDVNIYGAGPHTVSKFDLTFMFIEAAGGLYLSLEYNSDLYKPETAERLQTHFAALLASITASPSTPISKLAYIGEAERTFLLQTCNKLPSAYTKHPSVISLFQQQVLKMPEAIAVRYGTMALTYRELDEKSDQLAGYLRKNCNIGRGDLAGIMLDRSEKMIICIMGVLKAGGAYVPIDPSYPATRREYIMADTAIKILLTQSDHMFDLGSYEGAVFAADIQLDSLEGFGPSDNALPLADDLAYVIYTSGSTGQPKGCAVTDSNLANYIHWANEYYFGAGITPDFGLYTSLSFDLTVTSIFCSLTLGGSLYVYNQHDELSSVLQHSFSNNSGINSIKLTPSHIRFLQGLGLQNTTVHCAIVGGEAVSASDVSILKSINPAMRVYNEYGPTEATVGCVVKELEENTPVSIGYPLSQTGVYVLDSNGELCGTGIAGELYIAGACVTRGYLNKVELTNQKFVNNPFRAGELMYKTGDICRRLSDGDTLYLGRQDEQVKIRGYRVETGEIEAALLNCDGVETAAVTVLADASGNNELAAYITGRHELTRAELNVSLGKLLPAYMIPVHFIQLEELPLTVNGKTDKKALSSISGKGIGSGTVYVAPVTEAEEVIVAVYEEVLKKKPVGIKDDFFALGGDSIKSLQIIARLRQRGYILGIPEIMLHPVAEDLALRIQPVTRMIDQELVEGKIPLSPVQQYFFETIEAQNRHHYNQSVLLCSNTQLSEDGIRAVLNKLILHHDALRMVFEETPDGWMQYNRGAEQTCSFELIKVISEQHFTEHCERIQSTINLQHGPLFRVILFRNDGEKDHLMLVAHHLVIDGVSWRILFEDLSTLYQQYLAGQELTLPLKSDSFMYWQQKQREYAGSLELLEEEPYWTAVDKAGYKPLEPDLPGGSNLRQDSATQSVFLDEQTTAKLLTECYKTHRTEINDILITALCLGLKQSLGLDKVLINLEGHGREDINADIDISRTAGWFTTMYPVLIDISSGTDIIRQMVDVKECLHRVPNKGIGYWILRYLAGKNYSLNPAISFNYLGDFGSGAETANGDRLFEFSGRYHGKAIADDIARPSLLNVSGMVVAGCMRLSVEHSSKQFLPGTIENLLKAYQQQLVTLIERITAEEEERLSPVDLTYKGLSIDELEKINKLLC